MVNLYQLSVQPCVSQPLYKGGTLFQIISFKLKAFDRRVNLVEEGKHDRKEERRKSNKTITEGEKERD